MSSIARDPEVEALRAQLRDYERNRNWVSAAVHSEVQRENGRLRAQIVGIREAERRAFRVGEKARYEFDRNVPDSLHPFDVLAKEYPPIQPTAG